MGVIEVPTEDLMNHKQSIKYAGNHYTGVCNEDQGHNQKQMPNRKGNVGYNGRTAGPVTAKEGVNVQSGARKWMPSATENYVGNPDKMNAGASRNRTGNLK